MSYGFWDSTPVQYRKHRASQFDDGPVLNGLEELSPPRGKAESSGNPLMDTWLSGVGPASTEQLIGVEEHHLQNHVVRVKAHGELLGTCPRRPTRSRRRR